MRNTDYTEFCDLLDAAYDLIGAGANKIISGSAKRLFFAALAEYPIEAVRKALSAHCRDKVRGRFTPKPADIIEQIEGAVSDGRPSVEEAWAIALTSRDESDTVVWTNEIAEAFVICQPVLSLRDEVGARMAFKDAYSRIVAQAKSQRIAPKWTASLGWDMRKREASLTRASNVGLLPAPTVAALLPAPEEAAPVDAKAKEQIGRIKELLTTMNAEKQRENELHAQREREATAAAKKRAADQTANYKAA